LNRSITIITAISIVSIAISFTTFIMVYNYTSSPPALSTSSNTQSATATKREFWLFNSEIPHFNETKMDMPHDVYSMPSMTVNKGDTVVIHFFNIEEPGGDNHSFTIYQPYNINVVLHPGQNKTITFTADHIGVFTYLCTFHYPTMRGQLVVMP
jgi:plastocyanin